MLVIKINMEICKACNMTHIQASGVVVHFNILVVDFVTDKMKMLKMSKAIVK